MSILLVGLGGTLGSLTRYSLGKLIPKHWNSTFPMGTALINVSGAIFLGLLSTFSNNKNLYLLLGDGFLGAYTTFSTFMYEGFTLFKGNEKLNAFTYIVSSLVLGLVGYKLGSIIGYCF